MKSPAARAACEWLLVPVCMGHNISKLADAAWARKLLALRLAEIVGTDWLSAYIDGVEWRKPETRLSWADILAAPDPPEGLD